MTSYSTYMSMSSLGTAALTAATCLDRLTRNAEEPVDGVRVLVPELADLRVGGEQGPIHVDPGLTMMLVQALDDGVMRTVSDLEGVVDTLIADLNAVTSGNRHEPLLRRLMDTCLRLHGTMLSLDAA